MRRPDWGKLTRRICAAMVAAVLAAAAASAGAAAVSGRNAATAESALGNIVADAIRQQTGADIAFVPAALLRPVDIPDNAVTADAIGAALTDCDEAVAVLRLSGRQVQDALERSVSLEPRPHAGFLQISGISFRYDPSQAPGKRLGDVRMGRRVISADETYTIAMPHSLATGGLGYFRVWGNSHPEGDSKASIRDALKALLPGPADPERFREGGRIRQI